jgi:hypothetical protein
MIKTLYTDFRLQYNCQYEPRKLLSFQGNIGQCSRRLPVCGFFRSPLKTGNDVCKIHKNIKFAPHRKHSVHLLEVAISESRMKRKAVKVKVK